MSNHIGGHFISTQMKTRTNLIIIILLAFSMASQAKQKTENAIYHKGGIVRLNPNERSIMLVFTCADMADGAPTVLKVLEEEKMHASFFMTGSFMNKYPEFVRIMKKQHHYIGSHSYGHLLYSTWDKPDSTIITKEEFNDDMRKSFDALQNYGIKKKNARYFMPPYEHYNDTISAWAAEIGLQVINFTAGSTSNADYTTPDMKNYRSSETIYNNILQLEEREGLNGHIMLFHIGTVDAREDKFYAYHLKKLITELKHRGYKFECFQ